MNPADLTYLLKTNSDLQNYELAKVNWVVLNDLKFQQWPGSVGKHHAQRGGLVEHVAQVMRGARGLHTAAVQSSGARIPNWDYIATGVIWHDYGKVWDYAENPHFGPGESSESLQRDKPFLKTDHYELVRHVARSYAEWMRHSAGLLSVDIIDEVGHIVLSHHGRKDWGSPVEPATPEAWLVHLADMASAKAFVHGGT